MLGRIVMNGRWNGSRRQACRNRDTRHWLKDCFSDGPRGIRSDSTLARKAAVEKYIDGAALCVFPSLSENFPLVGLE